MKRCTCCKEEKPLTEFNFKIKSKGILNSNCKKCSRLYIQNHYKLNKLYYLEKARIRNEKIRKEIKQYLWSYLKDHPCLDCGETDPIVLKFDHIANKTTDISRMYRNFTFQRVQEEVLKCQVRCANCHRRKTALQFGWHKDFMRL